MTTATTFRKGDRVTSVSSKYPGSGVVEKVNPRTIAVLLDSGMRVKFDAVFLVPEGSAPDAVSAALGRLAGPPETVAFAQPTGTFVRYTGPSDPRLSGIWVVVGDQGGKTRIVRPNGTDGSRYWRIPNGQLTKVTCTVIPQD